MTTTPDGRSKAQRQAAFLEALRDTAMVKSACTRSKVPRATIYNWLKADKTFKKKYDAACQAATLVLEDEAVRRAVEGRLKPVFHGGKKVGTVREYSDTLLVTLLKARAPEKYRDRQPSTPDDSNTTTHHKPKRIGYGHTTEDEEQ